MLLMRSIATLLLAWLQLFNYELTKEPIKKYDYNPIFSITVELLSQLFII